MTVYIPSSSTMVQERPTNRIPKLSYRNRTSDDSSSNSDSATVNTTAEPNPSESGSISRHTATPSTDSFQSYNMTHGSSSSISQPPYSTAYSSSSRPSSRPSLPSSGPSMTFSTMSQKKKKGKGSSVFGFLTLKEPSQKALEEFAAREKQRTAVKGGGGRSTSTTFSNVSQQKLPQTVPKVNSKWDGMPMTAETTIQKPALWRADSRSTHRPTSSRRSTNSSGPDSSVKSTRSSSETSGRQRRSGRRSIGFLGGGAMDVSYTVEQSSDKTKRPSIQIRTLSFASQSIRASSRANSIALTEDDVRSLFSVAGDGLVDFGAIHDSIPEDARPNYDRLLAGIESDIIAGPANDDENEEADDANSDAQSTHSDFSVETRDTVDTLSTSSTVMSETANHGAFDFGLMPTAANLMDSYQSTIAEEDEDDDEGAATPTRLSFSTDMMDDALAGLAISDSIGTANTTSSTPTMTGRSRVPPRLHLRQPTLSTVFENSSRESVATMNWPLPANRLSVKSAAMSNRASHDSSVMQPEPEADVVTPTASSNTKSHASPIAEDTARSPTPTRLTEFTIPETREPHWSMRNPPRSPRSPTLQADNLDDQIATARPISTISSHRISINPSESERLTAMNLPDEPSFDDIPAEFTPAPPVIPPRANGHTAESRAKRMGAVLVAPEEEGSENRSSHASFSPTLELFRLHDQRMDEHEAATAATTTPNRASAHLSSSPSLSSDLADLRLRHLSGASTVPSLIYSPTMEEFGPNAGNNSGSDSASASPEHPTLRSPSPSPERENVTSPSKESRNSMLSTNSSIVPDYYLNSPDTDGESVGLGVDIDTISLAPSEAPSETSVHSRHWYQITPQERLGLGGKVIRHGAMPWERTLNSQRDWEYTVPVPPLPNNGNGPAVGRRGSVPDDTAKRGNGLTRLMGLRRGL